MVRRMIRAYLSLTRGERNGFFVLAMLVMVLLAGRLLIPVVFRGPAPDFREAESAFLAFRSALQESTTGRPRPHASPEAKKGDISLPRRDSIQYFTFDPNQIPYEDLIRLGLPTTVARTLVNYRNSGGRFITTTDLMKVYGMGKEDFQRLEPHVSILPAPTPKKDPAKAFELNSADTLQLLAIFGIGPVFAGRITRYRDLLGGFHSGEQLKEVYGLQEQQYREIMRHAFVDTGSLRRMDLNTVDRETLAGHPYLTAYQADALLAYREFNGSYMDLSEIPGNQLLPDSVFMRVRPYLRIGP